ncbi:FG-GAP repeat domain-containing protein, partial [Vibrio anguillarum]|uniref:FG-GAP repeat domain-containing protein n=1 Tax=Vibrio anguillarum TaxID=55601 RepID=UPI00399D773A
MSISSIAVSTIATASNPSEINTQLKWSWESSSFKPESNQVMAAPVIAQLNDDNGDGKIDENDIADIIVVTFENNKYTQGGLVRALSGIDGSELWSYDNGGIIADARYSPAVADLDGNGVVDIVITSASSPYITILDNEGNIKKQILKHVTGGRSVGTISISDLNNDGSIEIISADGVYNYDTGLLFSLEWAPSPISFDADGDGVQEIFSNGALYKSDGSFTWQYQANDTVWFSSVANLDSDNKPEIVVSVPATKATAQNSVFAVLEH